MVAAGEDFAFETTLAGRGYLNARSLSNLLNTFSVQVDACRCFMNSDAMPELIFEQLGEVRNIIHADHYRHLQQEAQL